MLLELKDLKRVYDKNGSGKFIALDKVSLEVEQGDFVSVIGRSGSGKSTMLNMIVGILRPTSGKVLLKGVDLWSLDDKRMAYVRNSQIGYVSQGLSLLSNLTILDNVRLPHFLFKREGDGVERATMLLEKVGLKNMGLKYPSQLSGGEMRKASIARALMNEPELLIADEPTSNLDEENTQEIMNMLTEICEKGTTILMVTHELDTTCYANRVLRMKSGRLTEESTVKLKAMEG